MQAEGVLQKAKKVFAEASSKLSSRVNPQRMGNMLSTTALSAIRQAKTRSVTKAKIRVCAASEVPGNLDECKCE